MNNPLLAQAISTRHLLTLQYDGFTRSVEPHAYGVDKDGHEKLRCWQVAGGSVSGETAGWKLLNVSDIRATTTSQSTFSFARPGYKRQDSAMQRLYAQL
jgi:hypothetical protein